MIKLSLFMTDPLRAHERYQKEISDMESLRRREVTSRDRKIEDQRQYIIKLREEIRQLKCEVRSHVSKRS